MKKNRKALSLALGGLIVPLGLTHALEHATGQEPARPLSSVGHIGDASDFVRDTNDKDAVLLSDDTRPEAFRHNTGSAPNFSGTSDGRAAEQGDFYTASHLQAPGAFDNSITSAPVSYGTPSMYESVIGSPEWTSSSSSNRSGTGSRRPSQLDFGWAEVDALLWWGPTSNSPPLVVQGPVNDPGNLANLSVAAGGEDSTIGGDLLPGIRANLGVWLDDNQSTGVGARFTTLLAGNSSHQFASDGSQTLGLPFFNVSTGAPDTFLVGFATNPNNRIRGTIDVDSKTSLIQAEAYGRFLIARTKASRSDLLCGYTFARLDDTLGILSQTDGFPGNIVFDDRFSTQNTFHGGHLGFITDVTRGRLSFSTLSKVSIGNMHQVGTVEGTSTGGQGFYARDQGTQTRDVFTFLPEAGAKLRYQVTQKAKFNVGYSFLFFPDVARAGGLIDTNIDITPIGLPTAPQPRFSHDSFYLHGIDIGFTYSF